MLEIRGKARRLKAREPNLGLIMIDYLQLMSSGSNIENRVQEVSQISRSLKVLAGDLEVPVVALSQLSRAVESRTDKRPLLSDLRESGSIEQDADLVMFLYRDEYYNEQSEDQGLAEVILAKHRNGPIGTEKLAFLKRFAKFSDLAPAARLAGGCRMRAGPSNTGLDRAGRDRASRCLCERCLDGVTRRGASFLDAVRARERPRNARSRAPTSASSAAASRATSCIRPPRIDRPPGAAAHGTRGS